MVKECEYKAINEELCYQEFVEINLHSETFITPVFFVIFVMVEISELNAIREELETLLFLYKKIAEQRIPVEEPSPGDIVAIESDEETYDIDDAFTLLNQRRKD